jgi:hypothetical protein
MYNRRLAVQAWVRRRERTDAMNRPNAPPRAKPMVPDKTVFAGQDSIIICIYSS